MERKEEVLEYDSSIEGKMDVERFPDIEKFVVENGIGVFTGLQKTTENVIYPMYLFNEMMLAKISADGLAEYEECH